MFIFITEGVGYIYIQILTNAPDILEKMQRKTL